MLVHEGCVLGDALTMATVRYGALPPPLLHAGPVGTHTHFAFIRRKNKVKPQSHACP